MSLPACLHPGGGDVCEGFLAHRDFGDVNLTSNLVDFLIDFNERANDGAGFIENHSAFAHRPAEGDRPVIRRLGGPLNVPEW